LYGVIAGSVAERTREVGLRSALGASPAHILSLVVRQGLTLAGIGVAIGLAIAAAATRALETLLYGVTSLDPITYGGAIVLLAAVAPQRVRSRPGARRGSIQRSRYAASRLNAKRLSSAWILCCWWLVSRSMEAPTLKSRVS
jgi:ABC-type lipoprotein release transport system permease subunit